METLNVCPSTLAEGFNTYSPTDKSLFPLRTTEALLLAIIQLPQDDIKIVLSGIRHILATIVFQLLSDVALRLAGSHRAFDFLDLNCSHNV